MLIENFDKVHEDLEEIRNSVLIYRDETLKLYHWNFNVDLRFKFLNQLFEILISHNLNISYIRNNFLHNRLLNFEWIKAQINVSDKSSAGIILENYITYNKLALTYTLSSIVERYLRVIWSKLNNISFCNDDIYPLRKKVFEHLKFDLEGNEWKALSILFNIRNTIHNNNIHLAKGEKLKDINIHYHNRLIFFKDNSSQGNSTYENFHLILNDVLNLSKMINSHEVISKIPCIKENLEFNF